MHPIAYARGSVTLAESTRLLPSRDRQGAVSSEIPKTFKHPRAGDESCESQSPPIIGGGEHGTALSHRRITYLLARRGRGARRRLAAQRAQPLGPSLV